MASTFTVQAVDISPIMEFMTRQIGPSDVPLSFDGRYVADRKYIGSFMEAARHVCELRIVYAPTDELVSELRGHWIARNSIGSISQFPAQPFPPKSDQVKQLRGRPPLTRASTPACNLHIGMLCL